MYKMLIVDDEPEIVDSLYELFMSSDMQQLEILKVYSGREALACINKTKIDILLTDIRMPGIDGLQLAEQAKSNWPMCRVLFLTGYNDFEYAYTAIKKDCDDYILKTESNRIILNAVENALMKIESSIAHEELISNARKQMGILIPLLQKDCIMDLVEGIAKPSESMQEHFKELEIPLNISSKVYIIFGRIDTESSMQTKLPYNPEFIMAVRMIAEEALLRYTNKLFIQYDKTSFLYLLQNKPEVYDSNVGSIGNAAEDKVIIEGAIETIQNNCRNSLNITISFTMGSDQVEWELLSGRFSYLKKIMDFCTVIGKEAFLTDKSFTNGIFERIWSYESNLDMMETSNLKNLPVLKNYLERGMKTEYFELLTGMIECIKGAKSKNDNHAMEIYFSVANCLMAYINHWETEETQTFKAGIYKLMRVDLHESWGDAVDYIYRVSEEIFSNQKQNQNKMTDVSVKYVQQYIHDNINKELSLTKMAELTYFNPSYLSRLFKQLVGKNISEYILDERINKAKELLGQMDFMINEVAVMVGLDSATYFGRIFKKATNMTPQEYREFCLKGKYKSSK